jgi:hypothetical protein
MATNFTAQLRPRGQTITLDASDSYWNVGNWDCGVARVMVTEAASAPSRLDMQCRKTPYLPSGS